MKVLCFTVVSLALAFFSHSAMAQQASAKQLIQQLNVELPAGIYNGKGYNHPCQVTVRTQADQAYQVVVQLQNQSGRVVTGEFTIGANSQKHPGFETPNYVGASQNAMRTFVVVASNDAREGYRLIITQKDRLWSIKAGALKGVDATCVIQR